MTAVPIPAACGWTLRLATATLLCWLAYLLVAPTVGFSWIDSWHNEQRAMQVVLLACTALVFGSATVWHPHMVCVQRGPALLLGTFIALGVISAMWAAHPLAALAEVSLFTLLASLAALTAIASAAAPERAALTARYFALFFCAAYALGVAMRLLAALQLGQPVDLQVLVFGHANPRFPSAFHAALLPFVALVAVAKGERRSLRVCAFAVLTAIWAINWGLGTRGIWFAYLLALPALTLLAGWQRAKGIIAALAITALFGVLCFEALVQLTASVEPATSSVPAIRPTSNTTLTSREVLWGLSWDAIRGSPFLGIGPMHFAALGSAVGAHPHNWVLQTSAEWGLPATLILVALSVLLVAQMRMQTSSIAAAVTCSILASAALGLVDGNLVMPITQTAFALVVGLGLGLGAGTVPGNGKRVALAVPLAVGALAGSMCLAAYAVWSFPLQEAARDEFLRTHPGLWLLPRFWEHGLF